MKSIDFKGVVVDDAQKEMYDWYGVESVSPNDVISILNENPEEEIVFNIDSIGGSIAAGSQIFTAIKEHKGKTIAKINARAYSISSIVPLAADEVVMSPTALYMIHNVSLNATGGDYREYQKKADMLKNATDGLAQMYVDKTGIPLDEILDMMNKETYLNAQQAKEKGFVDAILFEKAEDLSNQYGMVASGMQMLTKEQIEKFDNKDKLVNKQYQELQLLKLKK